MKQPIKKMFLVFLCLSVLAGQAMADTFSEAEGAFEAGDYAKAEKLLKPLASEGHVQAQVYLGSMYDFGNGVPLDRAEAIKWYNLAAGQGNAPAQVRLGAMYLSGIGVPKDYREALKWFHLAAEQHDVIAQMSLGMMYQSGKGVPQDYVMAYMWNWVAANEGEDAAVHMCDLLAPSMTAQQIDEATKLTKRCLDNHLKGC